MLERLRQGSRLTPRTALDLAAPHTWPACSILPSTFAVLLCRYQGWHMTWELALLLPAICVLMQSSVNTLNDCFDFLKGTDTAADAVEPSDSVMVYARVAPLWAGLYGLALLGLAGLLGLRVIVLSGPAPLVVGLIGAATVLAYSAGPFPLSYWPVGELVSGVTMGGLIPLGIFAASTGRIRPAMLLPAVPFVLGISLVMLVNNTSDIEKDRAAGRRTLPALAGRRRSVALYRALLLTWSCAVGALAGVQFRLAALVLIHVGLLGARPFKSGYCAGLLPQNRVANMNGILRLNLILNGGYLAALILAFLGTKPAVIS